MFQSARQRYQLIANRPARRLTSRPARLLGGTFGHFCLRRRFVRGRLIVSLPAPGAVCVGGGQGTGDQLFSRPGGAGAGPRAEGGERAAVPPLAGR